MLKEMAPGIRRTTLLFNPVTAPYYPSFLRQLQAVSTTLATELVAAPVEDKANIERAMAAVAREPISGLITGADPSIFSNRALVMNLAERYRCPRSTNFDCSPRKVA